MERRERGSPSTSYYSVLGASVDSSTEEIRRAYRKLALQWHPDRWTRNPALLGKAKRKFQEIQEAYSVLSDNRKRSLYDAGLYDPEDEEDEGFCDFLQEMVNLMAQTRKEEKEYSMEELQKMLSEMAQGFGMELSSMSCRAIDESGSGGYKRLRWDSNSVAGRRSRPGFQLYGASSYCH